MTLPQHAAKVCSAVRELSERLHVLLSPEQAEQLRELSAASGRPIGQLVRDAIGRTYSGTASVSAQVALNRLGQETYIKEETWADIEAGLNAHA